MCFSALHLIVNDIIRYGTKSISLPNSKRWWHWLRTHHAERISFKVFAKTMRERVTSILRVLPPKVSSRAKQFNAMLQNDPDVTVPNFQIPRSKRNQNLIQKTKNKGEIIYLVCAVENMQATGFNALKFRHGISFSYRFAASARTGSRHFFMRNAQSAFFSHLQSSENVMQIQ